MEEICFLYCYFLSCGCVKVCVYIHDIVHWYCVFTCDVCVQECMYLYCVYRYMYLWCLCILLVVLWWLSLCQLCTSAWGWVGILLAVVLCKVVVSCNILPPASVYKGSMDGKLICTEQGPYSFSWWSAFWLLGLVIQLEKSKYSISICILPATDH